MFRKLLIANRGEIAARIIRTAREMGLRTVAVYSDADRDALHVETADEAWRIGPAPALESYLDMEAILGVARKSGAEAIHPGYGFLSENPAFADAVQKAGLAFVGPPAAAMRLMGLKGHARRLMRKAGVPVIPGYDGEDQSPERLAEEAQRIGYPVLLKPVAGGGGKGMRIVQAREEFTSALDSAGREAQSAFGDGRVLVEKYLPSVRHIEVQVMADGQGNVIHLWERDCTAQRRHQKVIEEAPAPGLPAKMRIAMCKAATDAAREVGYEGAGTVEFLAPLVNGALDGSFYFIEMNTRLQVEHPVTEMITGLDLVELQLRIAAGEALPLRQEDVACDGHAIEARLYAEDPAQGFKPQTGTITRLVAPPLPGLRFDTGVKAGDRVTADYDAMIGKLIAHGPTRDIALKRLHAGLDRMEIGGLRTNLSFLQRLLRRPEFISASHDTGLIDRDLAGLTQARPPPLAVLGGAVLGMQGWLDKSADSPPFESLRNFDLWPGQGRRMWLCCDGRELVVTVQQLGSHLRVLQDGESFACDLLRVAGADVWLGEAERVHHLLWGRDQQKLFIAYEGEGHTFTQADFSASAMQGSGGRVIKATVPGRLAKLMVDEGADVSAGDVVAIIEAMKTEFSLRAEAAGTVRFSAKPGEQVKEGDVIAEIGEAHG